LIPKKAKDILEEYIDQNECDADFVRDLFAYYWSEIKDELISLEHIRFYVQNLGEFSIKRYRLQKTIEINEAYLKKNESTFEGYGYKKKLIPLNHKFKALMVKFKEEDERKKLLKELRMAKSLLDVWKNKSSILEGIKNSVFKKETVEQIANARFVICSACPHIDRDGKKCLVVGSAPCCSLCGCKLGWKTRSLSEECADVNNKRWEAVLTENEETELNKELGIEEDDDD